ncbi:MAG TPA: hypothetical protein VF486_18485 [Actinomycetes bacterium]
MAVVLLASGCSVARDLSATYCPSGRRLLPQGAADYFDFVQVGGTTYHAGTGGTGPALREGDLGAQVAVVRCKLADHMVEDPDKRYLDGDAAYLDEGTALYAVRGYRPSFRLGARRDRELVLFEAVENPRARTWGDLLDLGGKVRWIGVNDDHSRPLAAIRDRRQVARLVALLLGSRVGKQTACADDGVFLAFHLDDATATTWSYSVHFRRLDCRDPLPQAFGAAIRAALR